ncbi:MAG: peptidoglycan DD-metalloendopeptidase family protein [Thiohalomonadaceae bacterium]
MRILLLLLLLLPGLSLAAGSTQQAPKRHAKEAELQQLRERITVLRGELNKVRSRYDALRDELRGVEESVAQANKDLRQLDVQLNTQTRRLDDLQKRRKDLQGSIAMQRQQLAQQIRAAYVMGRQEYLKILLNQENPATLGRALTYYDYLNRARAKRITTMLAAVQQLEDVQQEIEFENQRLGQIRDEQRQHQAKLKKTLATRSDLLAELKQEMNSKDQRLKGMLADERELEKLIMALAQALGDIPPEAGNQQLFAKLRGKLPWPVQGRIVASYGSPRLGNIVWQGVLLGANEGLPVRAVFHGRVAFADWLRGFGYLMILDHGDGYMSLYGNNQSLHKEVGDWVAAGETIASVGASGSDNRTGVYFEIRRKGKPQDPTRWCRR